MNRIQVMTLRGATMLCLAAGCAEDAPTPPVAAPGKQTKQTERRKGRLVAEGALTGNALTVRVTVYTECRTITTTASGGKSKISMTEWSDCDSDRVEDAEISVTAGSIVLTGKTNEGGKSILDLTTIVRSTNDPGMGHITATLPGGEKALADVSLGGAPAYARWKAVEDSQRKAAAEAIEAKADNQARQAHAQSDAAVLQEIEAGLMGERFPSSGRWTDEQLARFKRLHTLIGSISGERFTKEEKARRSAVERKMGALLPAFTAAWEAARVEGKRRALITGRKIVLASITTPSTASFVGDEILLQCSSGFLTTVHDVDFQNAFGAMIRRRMCVKFNPTTEKIVASGDGAGGFSLDTACSAMWLKCDVLDGWKALVGF